MQKNTKVNIFADGKNLDDFKLIDGDFNIVLDGFANRIANTEILPDLIIGDMDSITQSTQQYFTEQGVIIVQNPCQDTTDLEKAILYCISQNFQNIDIYNALGGRTDHHQFNLGLLKKYHAQTPNMKIINGDEEIIFIRDTSIQFNGKVGSRLSLMAFNAGTINSSGLKYDMTDYKLEHAISESACNTIAAETGKIQVIGEALLIIETSIAYKLFI